MEVAANVSFTTSGALVDSVDKKMIVVLRDGRKLIGVLRSYDQFANLVLQDTVERIYQGNTYGDIPRGIFLIRGENVVLLGEIDLDREDEIPLQPLPREALPELLLSHREEAEGKVKADKRKAQVLKSKEGFCGEGAEGDSY